MIALVHADEPSDDALLVAARAGDRGALEALARRYWDRVRRWALWEAGDPQLAEEAVQEAMIRLVRFVARCEPGQPFAPWLRTLVRHAAADARSRRRKDVDRHGVAADAGAPATADRDLDLHRTAQVVLGAFAALSPIQREVLHRVDGDGEAAADVARDLGVPAATVRSHLLRARAALRAALGDRIAELADLLPEDP
jgi:RNA polymerase sigma-70 factor (ECF subfamily)